MPHTGVQVRSALRLAGVLFFSLTGLAFAQTLPPVPTVDLPAPPSGGASLANGDVIVGDRSIDGVNGTYGLSYSGNATCGVNQFVNATNASGPGCLQPSFSNLSGVATGSQLPTISLGTTTNTANPSVNGDAATGFFTPGSSQIGVVAGGINQLTVKQTGLVVGTASGGGLGAGTVNAIGYYVNGSPFEPGDIPLGTSVNNANPQVSGDSTTGLYTPGVDQIGVTAAGVEQVGIGATGVVVGTATGGAQGSGTINATNLYVNGVPVGIGTGSSPGVLLTGDTVGVGTSTINTTTQRVNGISYPSSAVVNSIPVTTGTNTVAYETAPVVAGGTGDTALTLDGVLYGNGTNAVQATAAGNANTILTVANGGAPIFTAVPVLGTNSGTGGTLTFDGSSSGAVTIQPQAAAGTYNFNLPAMAGSAGQPLLSGGGGGAAQTYGILGVGAGGSGAPTTQGALNNFNAFPAGSAAYVIALCNGIGGDETNIANAAQAAWNLGTSVLIPSSHGLGGPGTQNACAMNNSVVSGFNGVHAMHFFGWPKEQFYQVYDITHGWGDYNISMNPGTNPTGFVTPNCFFDNAAQLTMSFTYLNMIGTSNAYGTVAICNGQNKYNGQEGEEISLDHVFVGGLAVGVGCSVIMPVQATGSYTFTANPTNGQNIVINGITWTFVTSGATGNQTNIQGSAIATVTQLATDLTASTSPYLTVASYTANSLVLNITSHFGFPTQPYYSQYGTAGNHYTLAAGTYGGTVSAATLTGGVDGRNIDTSTSGSCHAGLNYSARITDSTIINDYVSINGNNSDMFANNSQISGGWYSIAAYTANFPDSFGPNQWKIIGNRTEYSLGYDVQGVGNTLIIGNSFENIFGPIVLYSGPYNNAVFVGNSILGWEGCTAAQVALTTASPCWQRGVNLETDAALVFYGNYAGAGNVTATGNSFNVITKTGQSSGCRRPLRQPAPARPSNHLQQSGG
jgi:hypothetical protein